MGTSRHWDTAITLIIWAGTATLLWLSKDLFKDSPFLGLIGLALALICATICTVAALTSSEDQDEELDEDDDDPPKGG